MLGVFGSHAAVNNELTLRIEHATSFDCYSVFVSGQSATNFIVEVSDDLNSWQTVYQSLGYPGTNAVYQVSPSVEVGSRQFLRAVPGESVHALKQRWLESEPNEYTFRLRRMFDFWGGGIRGTVRVEDGAIVAVTDVVDDKTEQPITEPDLSQFLTISEIFEEIRREFEGGSEQVYVTCDPSDLFPARVYIDRIIGMADEESIIEATNFVPVTQ